MIAAGASTLAPTPFEVPDARFPGGVQRVGFAARELHARIRVNHRRVDDTDLMAGVEQPGRKRVAVRAGGFQARMHLRDVLAAEPSAERLLVVNFGRDLHLTSAPEPLLAPPENCAWEILWSSEHPQYGGDGTAPLDTELNWTIPGHAAVVLAPKNATETTAS